MEQTNLEELLRQQFATTAHRTEHPLTDSLARIYQMRARRDRWIRGTTIVLASLLGGISLIVAIVAFSSDTSPRPSVPAAPAIVEQSSVHTGVNIRSLAEDGGGGAWVLGTNAADVGLIEHVDQSGAITSTFTTTRAPGFAAGTGQGLWVSGSEGEDTVTGYDLTGRIVDRIEPLRGPIALGAGVLYGTDFGNAPDTAAVVAHDLGDGSEAWRVQLDGGIHDLVLSNGSVFVIETTPGPGGTQGVLLDVSATGSRELLSGVLPGILVAGGRGVWVQEQGGALCHVDASADRICIPVTIGSTPLAQTPLGLWVLVPSPSGATVAVIDPSTGKGIASTPGSIEIARAIPPTISPVVGNDAVWLGSLDGSVLLIEAG